MADLSSIHMTSGDRFAAIPSHGTRWGQIVRLGWYSAACLAVGVFIASIPGYVMIVPQGFSESQRYAFNSSPLVLTLNTLAGLVAVGAALICIYLAGVLFHRQPNERMAIFLSFYLLVYAILVLGPFKMLMAFLPKSLAQTLPALSLFVTLPASSFLFLLFPDGRFMPRWSRWLGLASFLLVPVILLTYPEFAPVFSHSPPLVLSVSGYILTFIFLFSMLYAQVYRYRRFSTEHLRLQTKWVVYGIGVMLAILAISAIPYTYTISLPPGAPYPMWGAVSSLMYYLSLAILPVSLTVAVMRFRLYDIDLLINRTLVYGALTVAVAALYAFSVGAASVALRQGSQLAGLLLTAGIAAVLYRPLRRIVQRRVDRLLGPAPVPGAPVAAPAGQESLEMDAGAERPTSQATLSGRRLRLARTGWVFLAVVAVVILLLAIPGYAVRRPMGNLSSHLVYIPTPFMLAVHRLNLAAGFIAVLLSYGLALLLFEKRPDDRMALFMAYYLVIHGLLFGGPVEMLEPFWPDAAAVNSFVLMPMITFPLTMTLFAVFPDGRFVPHWTRWLLPFTLLLALFTATYPQLSLSEPLSTPLVAGASAVLVPIMLTLIYAQIYRYRHISTREQKQQTKWVMYGFLVMMGLFAAGSGPWNYALSLPPGTPMPWWLPPVESTWVISTAVVPITLAVAVLRYRLYDVDVLINRTLIYGGLTAAVVSLYVLVVGALGALFKTQENLFIALVATGLVAVLFQPLRQRLQRWANRVVYGERDDPFEALARLGRRLEGIFSPQMVYPTIVETVAQALKLPYAAIAVKRGEQYEVVEAHGNAMREAVVYPLVHQRAVVGRLLVGRRSPGEDFSKTDERLLRSFARQAGTAVHAVQLMNDLQRSRQQLVTTREEERLRLRRDLHDGLGPALASVAWQAESARELVYADPPEAVQLLDSTIEQAQSALTDIRRLVYGLRPPALDELGLVGALEQAVRRQQQMDATIEAPAPLPQLPAAVEVAAFRIVQEALKNAMEHGRAEHCVVFLALDGNLCLTIGDDGRGLPDVVTPGVGLVSMRERSEELGGTFAIHPRQGGGTEVEVSLPLESGG